MSLASDWGRFEAQSLCSSHHTARSSGRHQLPAKWCIRSGFHLFREHNEALALPTITVIMWSPSVCPLTSLLIGRDFAKIFIKFIHFFDLENRTQRKLLADHDVGPSKALICLKSWKLLGSEKVASFPLFFLVSLLSAQKSLRQKNETVCSFLIEGFPTWLQMPELESLSSALAFCPVHQQKCSISRPSTPFHLASWHLWHHPVLPGWARGGSRSLPVCPGLSSTARPTPRERSGAGDLHPPLAGWPLHWPGIRNNLRTGPQSPGLLPLDSFSTQ